MSRLRAVALIALTCIAPAFASGIQELEMKLHYTQPEETWPSVTATVFPTKEWLETIFPVPVPNTIGTNALDNAITLVELRDRKPRFDRVRRNFKKYASAGDMVFMDVFSPDTIGYTQTRGFNLFNVKTGDFQMHLVAPILEMSVVDVAALDWSKKRFLFHLSIYAAEGKASRLAVIDLTREPIEYGAYFKIEEDIPLSAKRRPPPVRLGPTTLYMARGEKPRLHALDEQLRPVDHPLLPVFNGLPTLAKAGLPRLHPHLPLAVYDDGATLWAATWDGNGPAQTFPILAAAPNELEFSPDGKWLAYLDYTNRRRVLVAMPVDPALPHRLGPPVRLAGAEALPDGWNGSCAWITEPTGIVCTVQRMVKNREGELEDRNELLKWDLSPGNIKKAKP